jgi:hypothetical protein
MALKIKVGSSSDDFVDILSKPLRPVLHTRSGYEMK